MLSHFVSRSIGIQVLTVLLFIGLKPDPALATLDLALQQCIADAQTTCGSIQRQPETFIYAWGFAPTYCYGLGGPNDFVPGGNCTGTNDVAPPAQPLDPDNHPASVCASVIHIDNLSVGEAVPIVGSPFSLVYFSDRVVGRSPDYVIHVPLVAANPVTDLLSVTLTITYAGNRSFTQTFAPTPNTSYDFVWDGKDSKGNFIPSTQVSVAIQENHATPPIYGAGIGYGVTLGSWRASLVGLGTCDDTTKQILHRHNGF